jgi:hypothetical protein
MYRRTFLAAASGALAANPALAVDGGNPLRQTPLRAGYCGTQFYDDKERQGLTEDRHSGGKATACEPRWAARVAGSDR